MLVDTLEDRASCTVVDQNLSLAQDGCLFALSLSCRVKPVDERV